MAILDFLKKKTAQAEYTEPTYTMPQNTVPVEQVLIMKQQGMSNPQIITTLQKNYSPQQIADALGQAEARIAGAYAQEQEMPEMQQPVQQQAPTQNITEEVETQINEKWKILAEELKPWLNWKEQAETQMNAITNDVTAIKSEVEKIHKAVFAQIQEYGQNLRDVGAEIKAMEKVFTQVLPELTSSVQDISRAAKQLKGTEKTTEKTKK